MGGCVTGSSETASLHPLERRFFALKGGGAFYLIPTPVLLARFGRRVQDGLSFASSVADPVVSPVSFSRSLSLSPTPTQKTGTASTHHPLSHTESTPCQLRSDYP